MGAENGKVAFSSVFLEKPQKAVENSPKAGKHPTTRE
jgi:hypothetical protein